jgi:hypothetical protein
VEVQGRRQSGKYRRRHAAGTRQGLHLHLVAIAKRAVIGLAWESQPSAELRGTENVVLRLRKDTTEGKLLGQLESAQLRQPMLIEGLEALDVIEIFVFGIRIEGEKNDRLVPPAEPPAERERILRIHRSAKDERCHADLTSPINASCLRPQCNHPRVDMAKRLQILALSNY